MGDKGDEICIALLGEFFPGRADFLAGFLIEANKNEKKLDVWRERQLLDFMRLLTRNAEELVEGYREQQIGKVARAARNILEIWVWVDYCNLSDAHAQQFIDGIPQIDDDFTRVAEAAKELGRQVEFLSLSRLCSQYAHPTSIALNSVDEEADAGFRAMFLKGAVEHAADALTAIRESIAKNFPQIDRAPVIGKLKPAA